MVKPSEMSLSELLDKMNSIYGGEHSDTSFAMETARRCAELQEALAERKANDPVRAKTDNPSDLSTWELLARVKHTLDFPHVNELVIRFKDMQARLAERIRIDPGWAKLDVIAATVGAVHELSNGDIHSDMPSEVVAAVAEVVRERDELKSQLADAQDHIHGLGETLAEQDKRISELASRCAELEERCSNYEDTCSLLGSANSYDAKRIYELEARLEEAERTAEERRERAKNAEAQRDELLRFSAVETDIRAATDAAKDEYTEAAVFRVCEERDRLKKQLAEVYQQNDDFRMELHMGRCRNLEAQLAAAMLVVEAARARIGPHKSESDWWEAGNRLFEAVRYYDGKLKP